MALIALPGGVWTQIAAPNFGSIVFQVPSGDVYIQLAAAQPASTVEAGLIYGQRSTCPPEQPAMLGTNVSTLGAWSRPVGVAASSIYVE